MYKVGDYMDLTKTYTTEEINTKYVLSILEEVANILTEKGYYATNQIVGYLMSGDPGYITSYKDARKKIQSIERSKILEVLVKEQIS